MLLRKMSFLSAKTSPPVDVRGDMQLPAVRSSDLYICAAAPHVRLFMELLYFLVDYCILPR